MHTTYSVVTQPMHDTITVIAVCDDMEHQVFHAPGQKGCRIYCNNRHTVEMMLMDLGVLLNEAHPELKDIMFSVERDDTEPKYTIRYTVVLDSTRDVEVFKDIEKDISRYITTITAPFIQVSRPDAVAAICRILAHKKLNEEVFKPVVIAMGLEKGLMYHNWLYMPLFYNNIRHIKEFFDGTTIEKQYREAMDGKRSLRRYLRSQDFVMKDLYTTYQDRHLNTCLNSSINYRVDGMAFRFYIDPYNLKDSTLLSFAFVDVMAALELSPDALDNLNPAPVTPNKCGSYSPLALRWAQYPLKFKCKF